MENNQQHFTGFTWQNIQSRTIMEGSELPKGNKVRLVSFANASGPNPSMTTEHGKQENRKSPSVDHLLLVADTVMSIIITGVVIHIT